MAAQNTIMSVEPENPDQRIAELERQLAETRRIAELERQLADAQRAARRQRPINDSADINDAVPAFPRASPRGHGSAPRDDRLSAPPRKVPAAFLMAEISPFRWWYVWALFMIGVAPIALWIFVPVSFTVAAVLAVVAIYVLQFRAARTRIALLKWGQVATVTDTETLSRGTYYSGTTWSNAPLPVADGWRVTRPLYSGPSTKTRIRYTLAGHAGELVVSGREYTNGVILADQRNPLRALCVTSFAYDLDRDDSGNWIGKIRPRLKVGMAVWALIVVLWLAFAAAIPTGVAAHVATTAGTTNIASGGAAHISGVNKTKTVNCNNGYLSVAGNSNTVTVRGHCASLNVSGNDNVVVVDTADSITVSGIDGRVTYHSGTPRINNSGIDNVVAQG